MDKLKQILNGSPNNTRENITRARATAIVLMTTGVLGGLYKFVTSPETMVLNLATLLVPVAIGLVEVIRQGVVASKKELKLSI